MYRKSNQLLCVIIFCEFPNKGMELSVVSHSDIIQALLCQPILLYVFNQSPYYKHSYTNPDVEHVHTYVSEHISNLWDVNPSWMMEHIPKAVRLLQAERLVVSEYRSPDQLEVYFLILSISF